MKLHYRVRLAQSENFARKLAPALRGGEVLALVGPLGSGKTTFTKALAKALSVRGRVTSPTFIIMNRYRARLNGKPLWLYHLDLYRTKNFRETAALGIGEIWGRPETITVIEWANKIKKHLPKKTVTVTFSH